jgi:iron uptake system EfeUOB component EfeO/EfeM
MNFDKAVEAFKNNPSAENAWELQKAMVVYSAEFSEPIKDKKVVKTRKVTKTAKTAGLKTRKGGKWDKLFKEVQELFAAFDWSLILYKSNENIEAWKVLTKDGNQAILYLSSDGFSMGGKKAGDVLTGEFEGYDDMDRFNDFLVSNDIEIDE